jgi:hypothetical protein
MVSEDVFSPKLTKFSLAVLNDSNWYDVQMHKAERITWGLDEGCQFLSKNNSIVHSEYCQKDGQKRCSDDLLSVTTCKDTNYSNSFFLNDDSMSCVNAFTGEDSEKGWFETFGAESLCQLIEQNNVKESGCFEIKCDADNPNIYTVLYGPEKSEGTCLSADQTLRINDNIQLTCLDPKIVCQKKSECANHCNWRGSCLEDNTCLCHNFYTGTQCQTFQDCVMSSIESKTSGNYFFNGNNSTKSSEQRMLEGETPSNVVQEVCDWVKSFNNIDAQSLPLVGNEEIKTNVNGRKFVGSLDATVVLVFIGSFVWRGVQ